MGFAFGRDIYKYLKRHIVLLILAVIFSFIILGLYTAGLWLVRNYRSRRMTIAMRLVAGGLAILAIVIYHYATSIFFSFLFDLIPLGKLWLGGFIIFFSGMLRGLLQRARRQRLWEMEVANTQFLYEHYLVEHEDGIIEDTSSDNNFRIEAIAKQRITLAPLGQRTKRAYIDLDSEGQYASFSGIVAI